MDDFLPIHLSIALLPANYWTFTIILSLKLTDAAISVPFRESFEKNSHSEEVVTDPVYRIMNENACI